MFSALWLKTRNIYSVPYEQNVFKSWNSHNSGWIQQCVMAHHPCQGCPLIKNFLNAKPYSDRASSTTLWRFTFPPYQPDTMSWLLTVLWAAQSYHNGLQRPSTSAEVVSYDYSPSGALVFTTRRKQQDCSLQGCYLLAFDLPFRFFNFLILTFVRRSKVLQLSDKALRV